MGWTAAPTLPPIELTPHERELFAGCEDKHYVRAANGTLAGHHVDPDGVPPPELAGVLKKVLVTRLLVSAGDGTRAFDVLPKWKLRWIKPSPSGRAFLVYFDTKLERQGVGGGLVVEYPVAGEPRVAVTGCEPGSESAKVWDADYVGDDETMVARIGEGARAFLALLVRDPASGRFDEVDSVPAAGGSLATCGPVVAVEGPESTALFGVVGQRLVPLAAPAAPAPTGALRRAFPGGARQIRWVSPDAELVLDVTGATDGVAPAPGPDGVLLRRIAGEHPAPLTAAERSKRLAACWSDTRLRDAAGVTFCTPEGRIGAGLVGKFLDAQRTEMVLLHPDGTVAFHETDGARWWIAGHPRDERALVGARVGEDVVLAELDLRTGAQVVLGSYPTKVAYLMLGEREYLLSVERADSRVRIWAREPMQPLGDAPLAEHDLGENGWIGFGRLGTDGFVQQRTHGERRVLELVRVIEAGGAIACRVEGPLVLPGARYDASDRAIHTSVTVGGDSYLVRAGWWFTA